MKKVLFSLFLFVALFFHQNLSAQSEKGQWLFGGYGTFNASTNLVDPDNDFAQKSISFVANIPVGYFLQDRFAVGIDVSYQRLSTGRVNRDPTVSHSLSSILFAKQYFGKGKVLPFVLAGVGTGWYNRRTGNNNGGNDKVFDFLAAQISTGVAFLIKESVSIEPAISFIQQQNLPTSALRSNFISAGVGVFFFI